MPCSLRNLPPLEPPLVYAIDGSDRIQAINEAYIADAGRTGTDEATLRGALIGQVLWEVLPGVAEWYGPLVSRARVDDREVCFPFRCDTPDLRRLMRMRITPDPAGAVTFESAIVGVQARTPVSLLEAPASTGPGMVTMCSWCKRVDAGGDWLEVEEAMERLHDRLEADRLPTVSHGICPRCLDELTTLARSPEATLSIGLPALP